MSGDRSGVSHPAQVLFGAVSNAVGNLARRCSVLLGARGRRAVTFIAVGASGVVVNVAVMAAAMMLGLHYLPASVIGTEVSILWNFALYERVVFHDRRGSSQLRVRMLKTLVYNNLEFVVRVPFLVFAVSMGVNGVVAQLALLAVAFVARYVFTSRFVYKLRPDTPVIPATRRTESGGSLSVTS